MTWLTLEICQHRRNDPVVELPLEQQTLLEDINKVFEGITDIVALADRHERVPDVNIEALCRDCQQLEYPDTIGLRMAVLDAEIDAMNQSINPRAPLLEASSFLRDSEGSLKRALSGIEDSIDTDALRRTHFDAVARCFTKWIKTEAGLYKQLDAMLTEYATASLADRDLNLFYQAGMLYNHQTSLAACLSLSAIKSPEVATQLNRLASLFVGMFSTAAGRSDLIESLTYHNRSNLLMALSILGGWYDILTEASEAGLLSEDTQAIYKSLPMYFEPLETRWFIRKRLPIGLFERTEGLLHERLGTTRPYIAFLELKA